MTFNIITTWELKTDHAMASFSIGWHCKACNRKPYRQSPGNTRRTNLSGHEKAPFHMVWNGADGFSKSIKGYFCLCPQMSLPWL